MFTYDINSVNMVSEDIYDYTAHNSTQGVGFVVTAEITFRKDIDDKWYRYLDNIVLNEIFTLKLDPDELHEIITNFRDTECHNQFIYECSNALKRFFNISTFEYNPITNCKSFITLHGLAYSDNVPLIISYPGCRELWTKMYEKKEEINFDENIESIFF